MHRCQQAKEIVYHSPLELVMDSTAIFLQFPHCLCDLDYYDQSLQLKFTHRCICSLDTQVFPKFLFDG